MSTAITVKQAMLSPVNMALLAALWSASCAVPGGPGSAPPGDEPPGVAIGSFSGGSLADWQEKRLAGRTTYELAEVDGRQVLSARCDATASGLYHHRRVDLRETPYLHWSWRVDTAYGADLDERQKSGDDFPARVFVVVDAGLLGLRPRAINYVWSSSQEAGARWLSPYSQRVGMIAVDAGPADGRWHAHRRNVRADLRQIFGRDFDTIDAVAVMTDCDDSGARGAAHYGDIYFGHR